jgi:hypothetical protein
LAINDVEHCEACEIHEDKIKLVSEHMPDEDELYDLAELFKIFGDSTRIRILYVLFESASSKYFEGTDGKGKSICPIDRILTIDTNTIFP